MPRKTRFSAEDIIQAALEMTREAGLTSLSAAAIAKKMGCSTMPIYSHFESLDELEEAVIESAWEMMFEWEAKEITGDRWVDQSIAYTRFAREEKHLFQCMWDSRHYEKSQEMNNKHTLFLEENLARYEKFEGLSDEELFNIRIARAIFSQGAAISLSSGWMIRLNDEDVAANFIELVSKGLQIGISQLLREGATGLPFSPPKE